MELFISDRVVYADDGCISREEELYNILSTACDESSICYQNIVDDEWRYLRCVKLIDKEGVLLYFSQDRHLSMIAHKIANWDAAKDLHIIYEQLNHHGFLVCEAEPLSNGVYTTSIMKLPKE